MINEFILTALACISFAHKPAVSSGLAGTADGTSASSATANTQLYQIQNFSTFYFSNLHDNFGYNQFGSCGYIALSMMMEFYDTYWDDDIVPDQYETISQFPLVGSEDGRYNIPIDTESPGDAPNLLADGYGERDSKAYHENYVVPNSDKSLHFHLMAKYADVRLLEPFGAPYLLSISDIQTIATRYLTEEMGYSYSQFRWDNVSGVTTKRQFLVDHIQQGIPCFAIIGDGLFNQHVVIAYDYDPSTDTIYYHDGYHGDSTHLRLEEIESEEDSDGNHTYYRTLNYVFAFSPTYSAKQTNNYQVFDLSKGTSVKLSSDFMAATATVSILSEGTNRIPAEFGFSHNLWDDPKFRGLCHAFLCFYDYLKGYKKSFPIINGTITISNDDWDKILKYPNNYYWVRPLVAASPFFSNFYGLYYRANDPRPYENILHMDAEDFDFGSSYVSTVTTSNYYLSTYFTVHAERLRCGYIEKSFINLSPYREGYGHSYLELTWNQPVYTVLVGLAKWNDEFYVDDNTKAVIELKNANGDWIERYDLINDLTLPIRRDGFLRMRINDQRGCWGFRIINDSSAIGTRNLNRISIDQFVFADEYGQALLYDNY